MLVSLAPATLGCVPSFTRSGTIGTADTNRCWLCGCAIQFRPSEAAEAESTGTRPSKMKIAMCLCVLRWLGVGLARCQNAFSAMHDTQRANRHIHTHTHSHTRARHHTTPPFGGEWRGGIQSGSFPLFKLLSQWKTSVNVFLYFLGQNYTTISHTFSQPSTRFQRR